MESLKNIEIIKWTNQQSQSKTDIVAVEEPLEISIAYYENNKLNFKNIAVTMRTPGMDKQLAIGFLYTENIITNYADIQKTELKGNNKICIFLQPNVRINNSNIQRNFYTTSSCGVCGKASLEAIVATVNHTPYPQTFVVSASVILSLPSIMQNDQSAFLQTGGIHSCSLFTEFGKLLHIAEDVGRHNAMDKLIGTLLMNHTKNLQRSIALLSGRASFELLQKAAVAGISIVCAIGAPSSLAIDVATEMDITLIGFLKNNSCNIYTGQHRIQIIK
jgi:FdhD protein